MLIATRTSTSMNTMNIHQSAVVYSLILIVDVIKFGLSSSLLSDYGVVIDAGSSGSRVRVYAWTSGTWRRGTHHDLPDIEEIHQMAGKPGISHYRNDSVALREHIRRFIEEAKNIVPAGKRETTDIFVLATAGRTTDTCTTVNILFNMSCFSYINTYSYAE